MDQQKIEAIARAYVRHLYESADARREHTQLQTPGDFLNQINQIVGAHGNLANFEPLTQADLPQFSEYLKTTQDPDTKALTSAIASAQDCPCDGTGL